MSRMRSSSAARAAYEAPTQKPLIPIRLASGGVSARTAQEALRHSRPELTAMLYTDPKLLDVAGALDVLPDLPISAVE